MKKKIEKYVRRILSETTEVQFMIQDYFNCNAEKIGLWMTTPNPMLGGQIPQRMISMGRTEKLKKFIKNALNGNRP